MITTKGTNLSAFLKKGYVLVLVNTSRVDPAKIEADRKAYEEASNRAMARAVFPSSVTVRMPCKGK